VWSEGVGREANEIGLVIDKTGAMDYKSLFSGRVSNGETLRLSGMDGLEETHLIVACLGSFSVSLSDATNVVFRGPLERFF